VGLSVLAIFNIFFYKFGWMYSKAIFFWIVSIFLGMSIACVWGALFSFPFIWIKKYWNSYFLNEKYQCFIAFVLLAFNSGDFLISYVFKSNENAVLIQWWISISLVFLFLIIYLFCLLVLIVYHQYQCVPLKNWECFSIVVILKRFLRFLLGVLLLGVDFVILFITLLVLFISTGSMNLVFHFVFSSQSTTMELILLPTLFMLMCISVYLHFTDIFFKFFSALFFPNFRKSIHENTLPSIGEVLSKNPHLTFAVSSMKQEHYKTWKKLHIMNLKEKYLIAVVADDYITSDDYPRVEVKMLNETDFEKYLKEIPTIDYVIKCKNGAVRFRNIPKFFKDQTNIDNSMYSGSNMILLFFVFSAFFLIPIIQNLVLGKSPINTSDTAGISTFLTQISP
jgi:hypothetical protein